MSDTPLLDIRDVQVWFPVRRGVFSRVRQHIKAVQGVSLSIRPGEIVGLVGESGCGKSTLARAIMMLERPASGRILVDGHDVYAMSDVERRAVRRDVQVVFQDPYASLNPRMPVYAIVTEGMVAHGLIKPSQQEDAAASLLQDVGLGADALYRYPHEFSGGQRQRIGIARALSLKPRLVVCDEAVSALDVSVQAQVINLLLDLRERYRLSYLFISHDLSTVKFIADRIAVMYLGRLVEEGTTEQVMHQPRHPYTQALLAAAPNVGGPRGRTATLAGEIPSVANPPPGCPFHTRCPHAMEICWQTYPPSLQIDGHRVSCFLYGNK